ncbi:MAG: hypothetical protein IJ650_04730 [Paludibacteraceae bacterium]|nr:hypothetical protein [Paludibacteraceae bacterium]
MKSKLFTLVIACALASSLFAGNNMQIFKPRFFGGDYQYTLIDSLKKAFLPTMLYELSTNGQHIGYALYIIGYTDYSQYTENMTYINRKSGNGAVYFLGVTKQQAVSTLQTLSDIADSKRSGNSLNNARFKMITKNGKVFYEEYYSMVAQYPETAFRIRKTVLGLSVKGVFISSDLMEPAFLRQKDIPTFINDIQDFSEPSQYASWENEESNGEVRFSAPIYVVSIGSSSWQGAFGSEMFLFRREYIHDETDTAGIFPDKVELFRRHWKYTVEDPSTMQGALLPLGDSINQAIRTIDEMCEGMERQNRFYKDNKIWFLRYDKMPEGYIYIHDMPREYALEDEITVKFESYWPELMWTYVDDADTKGLATNSTVLKKVRKILLKEKNKTE